MAMITVTSKGQIVIPSKIRKSMNIRKGAKLLVFEKGREIVLRPADEAYFAEEAGILATKGRLTRALLEDRARDKKREG